jgi:hypothetical protein
MTVGSAFFQSEIAQKAAKWKWYVNVKSELTLMATALGSDATVHDITIEQPTGILGVGNTPYQKDLNLTCNKGRAGNLPAATMAAAFTAVAATLP